MIPVWSEADVSMSAAERKAKKYFKTCMDAEPPEKVGSKPFLTLLEQVHTLFSSGGQ